MITATIIIATLALVAAFSSAWIFGPRLRKQIEDPKHWFQDHVQQYDRQCRDARAEPEANIDES